MGLHSANPILGSADVETAAFHGGPVLSTPSPSKLAELRARTDLQLLMVILRELDRALPMAKAAVNKESPLYIRAAKTYMKVRPLVSKVEAVSDNEMAKLEAKMKEVQVALERVVSKRI